MKKTGIIVLSILLSTSISLEAQTLFVNNAQQLWVSSGGLLTVRGSVDNLGEITNNGELSVSGNWIMQGNYMAGNGVLVFNGYEAQEIDHSGQEIAHLKVENGGEKTFLSDITLNASLELDSGILRAENGQQLILNPDVEVIGGDDYSFVEGTIVNKGTGYKIFPLGKNNYYLPIELLDVQGNSPALSAEIIEPHPVPQSLDGLETVSSQHYWQLATLSGTYEGSIVRIKIALESDFDGLTGLVVAGASDLSSTYFNLGNAGIEGKFNDGNITSELPSDMPVIVLGVSSAFSEEGKVLVPNAFAPNSPIEEDRTLTVFAANLDNEGFVFRIFNRWGKLVYETNSLDEALDTGWNGINQENNQPAQFGVYSYYLSGKFIGNNNPVIKKGTITLFR